jgi:hypothetical protein
MPKCRKWFTFVAVWLPRGPNAPNTMHQDYLTFVAQFATHDEIPAPFSHVYTLSANLQGPLEIDYSVHYTDREGLAEEDILDEGFSLDDDRQCKGTVGEVWQKELWRLLSRTKEAKQPRPGANELILHLTAADGTRTELRPGNQPEWEYLLQELTQALLESAQLEQSLHLSFLINRPGTVHQFEVEVSFAERQGTLRLDSAPPSVLPWPTCKELMKLTFTLDFDPEQAQPKPPKHAGFFIQSGDNLWYEGGVSALNPSPRNPVLGKLEEMLQKLQLPPQ